MNMKRIAINGLGRIGRMVLRHYVATRPKDIELVVANDLVPTDDLAYLIKYDSVHGQLPFLVTAEKDAVHVGDVTVKITAEKDPAKLPWKKLRIDAVIESTASLPNVNWPQNILRHEQEGSSSAHQLLTQTSR